MTLLFTSFLCQILIVAVYQIPIKGRLKKKIFNLAHGFRVYSTAWWRKHDGRWLLGGRILQELLASISQAQGGARERKRDIEI